MARRTNILVVEDEPNDALLIHIALHKTLPGVHISVVLNGIEAVEYLKASKTYYDRSVSSPRLCTPRLEIAAHGWIRSAPMDSRAT